MTKRDPWDGILDDGEEIIWQGRPSTGLKLTPGNIVGAAFGLLFSGFALFWMIMVSKVGGFFWMFGLLHFTVGAAIFGASLFGATYMWRRTWYTLTNRRAFIATDFALTAKVLSFYPITPETHISLHGSDPGSVYFHTGFRTTKRAINDFGIGFERIHDAPDVYRLMRDIQERHSA